MTEWFVMGGPNHGRWFPAGAGPVEMTRPVRVECRSRFGRKTATVPGPATVYHPTRMSIPGWVVTLPVWAEVNIATGQSALTFASVLPGGLHCVARDAEPACRWCYGRPMPGHATCSRTRCISDWHAVTSLDTMTWRGEER